MRTFQIRPYYLKKEDLRIPALDGGDSEIGKLLENAYNEALHVMFNVNCVNRNGKAVFVAGGEYSDVWTRDGSYNSYAAGSFLAPDVTENTLRALLADGMVNGSIAGGSFDDLQFWDKQLWIIAAYRHWLVTRNREFLKLAAGRVKSNEDYAENGWIEGGDYYEIVNCDAESSAVRFSRFKNELYP